MLPTSTSTALRCSIRLVDQLIRASSFTSATSSLHRTPRLNAINPRLQLPWDPCRWLTAVGSTRLFAASAAQQGSAPDPTAHASFATAAQALPPDQYHKAQLEARYSSSAAAAHVLAPRRFPLAEASTGRPFRQPNGAGKWQQQRGSSTPSISGTAGNSSATTTTSSGGSSRPRLSSRQPPPEWQEQQHSASLDRAAPAPKEKVKPLLHPAQLTSRIKAQTALLELQRLLEENTPVVAEAHVLVCLAWMVHKRLQHKPHRHQVITWLLQQVPPHSLDTCSCADVVYYCGKLGYIDQLGLYEQLLSRFMEVLGTATSREVSNVLWALGQPALRSVAHRSLLEDLLQRLSQQVAEARPRNLASSLLAIHAAAPLLPADSPQVQQLTAKLVERLAAKAAKANAQDVSDVLYALAELPGAWPMDCALQLLQRFLQQLSPTSIARQHAANVLWALGRYVEQGWLAPLDEQPAPQLQQAVDQLLQHLQDFRNTVTPQDVSNSLWGAAVLHADVDWEVVGQLLQAMLACQRPPTNAKHLAGACRAVATLHDNTAASVTATAQQPMPVQLEKPLQAASAAFAAMLHPAQPQAMAEMLWACAKLQHYPQQLLKHLAITAPAQLQQANAQAAADMAWALARLAHGPAPAALLGPLLQRMVELLQDQHGKGPGACLVKSQDLANMAWAVAVANQQQLAQQLGPLVQAAFGQQWEQIQEEAKDQWYQVHLWLRDTQVLGPDGLLDLPGLSTQQLQRCEEAWMQQLATVAKASETQQQVAEVMRALPGVEVLGVEQVDQTDGCYRIDIEAKVGGMRVAVEVDGPQHFLWPRQLPTGDTLARNWALAARGYCVVTVAMGEWDKQGSREQQLQFLHQLMEAAVSSSVYKCP